MVKKTLLSLAITASVAGLAGCNISSVERHNDDVDLTPVTSGTVGEGGTAQPVSKVVFDPSSNNAAGLPNISLITDLLLQGLGDPDNKDADGTDGTIPFASATIGQDGYNPIFSAVSDLDGFSTSGAIDIAFDGALDTSSIVTTPGATANVLLVPLNYINDPVVGGRPANNDAPQIDVSNPVGTPAAIDARVISYSDAEGANNILRIMPTVPLQSATRYLIVVTSGVKSASGAGVRASTTFNLLAQSETEPTGAAAALYGPVQTWVGLAKQVGAGLGQQLDTIDVAYATTFTTAGTTQVLGAMAAPAQVNAAVNQTAPASVRYLIEQELVKAPEDQNLAALVATLVSRGLTAEQAQGAIALASHLPQPAPRVATFDRQLPDISVLNGAIPGGGALPSLSMANGSIKMPYYLSAPNLPAAPITAGRVFTEFWQADDTLGSDLSALLTAAGIPASSVTPPSKNVTRHFPLAKTGLHTSETNPMGYVDVPVSVFYNAGATCDDGRSPIIYQHGITTNRLTAIPFTLNMLAANPCYAVVAMDLPLHGIEPFDATGGTLLGALYTSPIDLNNDMTVNATDNVLAGMFAQRHYGLTQGSDGRPRSMIADSPTPSAPFFAGSQSGSLFINIANFQNTRDNMRQGVMDLLNLNASIKFLDFDGSAGVDINPNATVKFAGHSLGGIIGSKFVALSNALGKNSAYVNPLEASVLANPGGNMTKLLENSFAFGPSVINGFKALGGQATPPLDLSQGSSLFELTLHIFQATLDSADPINFASTLRASAGQTGVLMYEIAGDGTASNPADLAVPPAAFAENGLPPAVLLDTDTENNSLADTAAAPLAGTTPLAINSGLTQIDASNGDGSAPLRNLVRYNTGTHASFGSTTDAVGMEMMGQVRSFFGAGGKSITVTNDAVVKDVPASN